MKNSLEEFQRYEDFAKQKPPMRRIVHSKNWGEEDEPLSPREFLEFDVMIDIVRQSGIFAEIELMEDNSARWIVVPESDVDRAKRLLREADRNGHIIDMMNERTEWY